MTDTAGHLAIGASGREHRRLKGVGAAFVLVLAALVTCAPMAFVLVKSFQPDSLLGGLGLEGWRRALRGDLPRAAVMSLILCVGSITVTLCVSTLAAYGFAKLPFKGSQTTLMGIFALVLLPLQTYIIAAYFNFSSLDLIGNFPAVILFYSANQLPFSIFVLTNFYRAIPDEIVEAALVDGTSYIGAFLRVLLPMGAPAMVTISVLNFIGVWNDLLLALLFLPERGFRTLGVVMASSQERHQFDASQVMAGSVFAAIPGIIVYLIFQRYIAVGLTAGAGK